MMMKRFCFLLFLLSSFILLLNGQENGGREHVRIAGINYMVAEKEKRLAGVTRENALRKFIPFEVGDVYLSPDDLEEMLDRVMRNLNAQKVFEEISYTVSYWREDFPLLPAENLGAHITIYVKDTLSLYVLPFALYDSNLGLIFGGSFTYNNVVGTLTNLKLEGYGGSETWRAGGTWEEVPIELLRGDFSLFCEQERTRRVDNDDETVLEYTNLLLNFSVNVEIPISYEWKISVKPGVYYPFGYDLVSFAPSYGKDEFDNLSPETTGVMVWGVSYFNVFWEENFRRGLEGEFFVTYEGTLTEWDPVTSLDGSVSAFYRPLSFLGMGHHLSGYYVFEGIRENAGQYIRGILDHLLYGEWGVFLNNNVDMRAFSLPPYFEMHGYPFIDLGVIYNGDTPYDAYDYRVTYGFGITLFPLFLQSLQLNGEIGFDMLNEGKAEISLTSELFF